MRALFGPILTMTIMRMAGSSTEAIGITKITSMIAAMDEDTVSTATAMGTATTSWSLRSAFP